MNIIMNVDYTAHNGSSLTFRVEGSPKDLGAMAELIGSGIQVGCNIHFDMKFGDRTGTSVSFDVAHGHDFADRVATVAYLMSKAYHKTPEPNTASLNTGGGLSYFKEFNEADWECFAGAESFAVGLHGIEPPQTCDIDQYKINAAQGVIEVHVAGVCDVWQLDLSGLPKAPVMAIAEAFAQELSFSLTPQRGREVLNQWGFEQVH